MKHPLIQVNVDSYKTIAQIPVERGGKFEIRETYMRSGLALQLYFENADGRLFSRYIFERQVEPMRDAINLYLSNRAAEQASEDDSDEY